MRVDLQELLPIALGDKVLGRHAKLLRQDGSHLLGSAVGESEVEVLRPHGIGMPFDQDDLVRIAFEQPVDGPRNTLELRVLVRSDLPGAQVEVNGIEINPPHPCPERVVVADLVERIVALELLEGWRGERLVNVLEGSILVLDDVFFARDAHDRRRQIEQRALLAPAQARPVMAPVVYEYDDATVTMPPIAAQQPVVWVVLRDDFNAARSDEDGPSAAITKPLGPRITEAATETLLLVVANNRAAFFAHDHAFVWLLDDRAATLHALATQPLDILDAAGLTDPAVVACAAISPVSAVVATVSLAAIWLRIALLGGPSVLALIARAAISPISAVIPTITTRLAATRARIALLLVGRFFLLRLYRLACLFKSLPFEKLRSDRWPRLDTWRLLLGGRRLPCRRPSLIRALSILVRRWLSGRSRLLLPSAPLRAVILSRLAALRAVTPLLPSLALFAATAPSTLLPLVLGFTHPRCLSQLPGGRGRRGLTFGR